jgi:arylsulfatase A-like enzyme
MKFLVIVLNRCQPAYLGCYGNDWLATPAIDRLASESVVFDQHYATDATAGATRWNWLTGQRCGIRSGRPLNDLLRLLWDQGIPTTFIGDERSPTLTSPMATGWESWQGVRHCRLERLEQESLLGGTIQTAVEWFPRYATQERWMLWLELGSLLPPWEPAEFDREALEGFDEERLEPLFDPVTSEADDSAVLERIRRARATYAGVVSGSDQWLGMLLEALRTQGIYNELHIVLTSDCGLPLGEHGNLADVHPWLYAERVHVPLLLKFPGNDHAGRRVHHLTAAVDLMPSLLDGFGIPAPKSTQGHSLLSVARGESRQIRDYLCSRARVGSCVDWSIRTHQWYYMFPVRQRAQSPRGPQLYSKPEDRWEVNDVLTQNPEIGEHLELTLHRYRASLQRG